MRHTGKWTHSGATWAPGHCQWQPQTSLQLIAVPAADACHKPCHIMQSSYERSLKRQLEAQPQPSRHTSVQHDTAKPRCVAPGRITDLAKLLMTTAMARLGSQQCGVISNMIMLMLTTHRFVQINQQRRQVVYSGARISHCSCACLKAAAHVRLPAAHCHIAV